MLAFIFFIATALPQTAQTSRHLHYDRIELNTYHNEWSLPVFSQLIFWDWMPQEKAYRVQAWKLLRHCWDKHDAAHRKVYDQEIDRIAADIHSISLQMRFLAVAEKYRGRFIGGPSYPRKDYARGVYWTRISARCCKDLLITADQFVETKTQFDPERKDRIEFPESRRKGFGGNGRTSEL